MKYSAADFVERIKELKEDVVEQIQDEGLSDLTVASIITMLTSAQMEIETAYRKSIK